MKTISIILKSLKEQLRSYWILLLTLLMGPFFIFVYFLIIQGSEPHYKVLLLNNDQGVSVSGDNINYGDSLISYMEHSFSDMTSLSFTAEVVSGRDVSAERVMAGRAEAMIIIDSAFSVAIESRRGGDTLAVPSAEITGDLTSAGYMISAVWSGEIINNYLLHVTHSPRILDVRETALGRSATAGSFDLMVPGLLIISIIMLMFTASIAFVSEVENKTILRLRLSHISATEFLTGIGVVQMLIGLVSIFLSLLTAVLLGFTYTGSLAALVIIASLTSLSIIAFSLIIAAVTKSAGEVLVAGNFPMFLFMFFTGAAFPLNARTLFTIGGYPISLQGLMSPAHAISALNKTLVMNMGLRSVIPEMTAIVILTIVYFLAGGIMFRRRHLKLA